jgi:uncharacterized protein YndB with AHSA1/START domain
VVPTRIEIDRWETGATLTHHFDDQPYGPLPGKVIECSEPHRLIFTWGEDTIGFELEAAEGGTTFVLTEELGAPRPRATPLVGRSASSVWWMAWSGRTGRPASSGTARRSSPCSARKRDRPPAFTCSRR